MSRIVIALGGNALGNTPKEQQERIDNAAPALIGLIKQGHEISSAMETAPRWGSYARRLTLQARWMERFRPLNCRSARP